MSIVKITNKNLDDEANEESLYRSPFHLLYDEGEYLGEVTIRYQFILFCRDVQPLSESALKKNRERSEQSKCSELMMKKR